MQNVILTETLQILNLGVTLASVIGIVHVLQEKFVNTELKTKNYVGYFSLRGLLTLLGSVQIYSALLLPITVPLLLVNTCTAAITFLTSKLIY
jgi:hypothetical protein